MRHLAWVEYGGLIAVIVICGVAGLGELRRWLSEGRELDRVQRLGDADNAARVPVRREQPLDPAIAAGVEYMLLRDGDGVIHPDPARDCRFCGLPYDPQADCTCPDPCRDPQCGARIWAAISNEEWER